MGAGDGRGQTIFREKSLDRAASPDQLDQCIHVSSPAGWMVLAALVLLLVAGIVWAALSSVPQTATVAITVENGQVSGSTDLADGTYDASVTVGEESLLSLALAS